MKRNCIDQKICLLKTAAAQPIHRSRLMAFINVSHQYMIPYCKELEAQKLIIQRPGRRKNSVMVMTTAEGKEVVQQYEEVLKRIGEGGRIKEQYAYVYV